MSEKLCVFCAHFDWANFEYAYYSTLTGGDLVGGFTCAKGHFSDQNPYDTEAFRKLILKAESCPDYSR